ncbi:MAG: hypothetical protein KAV44_11315 [Bacteroidales bacterium]|nr:hypothetical protein [Bacteroidales bacterium]
MKNKKTIQIILLSLFISLISLPYSLYSQEGEAKVTNVSEFSPGWAIGIKLGSFGPGIEIVKSFSRSFSIRAGGNYTNIKYNKTYEDLEVDGEAKIKLGAITLLGDWFFAKKIHLTAGVYYNFSEEIIKGTPTKSYTIGKLHIPPDEIGKLEIVITPNKICPYLGIGFGKPISDSKVVSFNFEIGAIYWGSPSTDMTATGMITPTASKEQEKIIDDNMSDFSIYPIITFQLSFKIL